MDERYEGGHEEPPRETDGVTTDGRIDFSAYNGAQLEDFRQTLDRDRFPGNFRNLLAEIDRRASRGDAYQPAPDHFAGQFTARDGLRGWFEASAIRSPVYGPGSIDVTADQVRLNGWQRTWLFTAVQSQVRLPLEGIRNVVRDGHVLTFVFKRHYRPVRAISFRAESPRVAESLQRRLPTTQTPGFEERWREIREFNTRLSAVAGPPVLTPALVVVNVGVFALMCAQSHAFVSFSAPDLVRWGANYGPLTVNGQWWRLLSALFVHMDPAHLILNMWALWNVGRLAERIFGRLGFAGIYFASGLLASLASIAWNPDISSVGASGAIFGILGALLAFFLKRATRVPASIARRQWVSTGFFVVFNLINGALQPGIDNAAHVGGLLAGLLLGWILSRPLETSGGAPLRVGKAATAAVVVAALAGAAIWQVKGAGSALTIPEQYYRAHADLVRQEAENVRLWGDLGAKASAGTLSDAELSDRFERDVVPFWRDAHTRLDEELATLAGPMRAYAALVVEIVRIRDDWSQRIVEIVKQQDSSRVAELSEFASKASAAQARLERVDLRARMDHRPRALANSPAFVALRRMFIAFHWTCIDRPAAYGPLPLATDDPADGPAARHALGCRAQQMFMSGDYRRLDAMMAGYSHTLGDLPDGGSRYAGVVNGLDDLFLFGRIDPLQLLGRTADWRRSVPDSRRPDLLEAMIFNDAAWTVRGSGEAKSVSAQQWSLFSYRNEMAAAALADTADVAATDPVWYQVSLGVGLDQHAGVEKLRALFDEGHARFADYRPLERRMMRILMPRWGGSYEQEDQFVNALTKASGAQWDYERYAELYSEYADMEGDTLDLFANTGAYWTRMQPGYVGLRKRYPRSDYVLNRFANMACRAGDGEQYRALRASLKQHYSSVAWTEKFSRANCDAKFAPAAGPVKRVARAPAAIRTDGNGPIEVVHALGGIRLGMSAAEVSQAKGPPAATASQAWSYGKASGARGGALLAVFSSSPGAPDARLVDVEYMGDQASAPPELPYLNGMTEEDLRERYGYLVGMDSPSDDVTRLKYRNGVFADVRNERVFRYGIYLPRSPR